MDGPQFEPELHKKFTEQVYKEVKEVLEKAIDNLNPRGACARQLAIHDAMARIMSDVITDYKIDHKFCKIPKEFAEQWALTQYQMKDKQDYFITSYFQQNPGPKSV